LEGVAEALVRLLRFYAVMRPGVVDILEATGQERFRVSVRSLRRVAGRLGVYGVDALLDAALRDESVRRRLEGMGVRVVVEDGEVWVEVPARMLIEFRREGVGGGPARDGGAEESR